jgi:hypothetical protein
MRRRARTDANHAEVVKAFRDLNCKVLDLSRLGGGIPDLLVSIRTHNVLVEVKDATKPPSARRLTPDQEEFFSTWPGMKVIVQTLADVTALVNRLSRCQSYADVRLPGAMFHDEPTGNTP